MKKTPITSRIKNAWAEVSGKADLARALARAHREAYQAAETNRLLQDWVFTGLAPDDELRWSAQRMRDRARELERNSPIARHFLRVAAMNTIGPNGIGCQPQVRDAKGDLDRALNRYIRSKWLDWCRSVTIDGKANLNSFSRLAFKTAIREGEAFVRAWRSFGPNPYGFALEGIDPDLVDETFNEVGGSGRNEVRLGVEVDQYSRPVAYHTWDRPARLLGQARGRERQRIPADEVLHLYDPDRMNQTRGVSWMVAAMVGTKHLDKFREAAVVKERIQASKMGFFERKEGDFGSNLTPDDKRSLNIEANPGTFLVLPDGYTVNTWGGDGPGTQFGEFIKDGLRLLATAYGTAYSTLSGDLSDVNYSSYKGGMLNEKDLWRLLQEWWIEKFQSWVYREWLVSAIIRGSATSGALGLVLPKPDIGVYGACRWSPKGWPSLEPLKETQAAIAGIKTGLTSRRRHLGEQGIELEDVLEDLAEEQDLAEEYGVDISGPSDPKSDARGGADDDEGEAAPKRGGRNGDYRESSMAGRRRRF